MNDADAVAMLSALAQDHRLRIFRRLVTAGPGGLPSSEIAQSAGISATSASFHLKELETAGLAAGTRDGRYIRYAVNVESMRALLTFLTQDCCQQRPELCGSAFESIATVCKGEQK